jgi:hypothetical protein
MRTTTLALIAACLAGCATLTQDSLNERFGVADPTRFDRTPARAAGGVSFRDDVRPVLESRCVVCHGCYDAPCQLKLGAWEGVARGASKALVYDATRFTEAPPSRLFVDAQKPSQWRQQDFFAVLNERAASPDNNLAASVLYRSLALKKAHPLPADKVLSSDFDFSLERAQSCPNLGQYDAYERDHPLGGMPYGLPGLNERELGVLTRWLAAGSPDDAPLPVPQVVPRHPLGRGTRLAGTATGLAPALRRPGRGPRVLPPRTGTRDGARQDAHALPAVAGTHDEVPRLVSRRRLQRRRAAVV